MSGTCGTCRFKGREHEVPDEEVGHGTKPSGYFFCELIKHIGDQGEPPASDTGAAFVVDGSGYFAALCVASDFGCNRWEPSSNIQSQLG